jgi:Fe-S-cluster-containing dehydrogenase component
MSREERDFLTSCLRCDECVKACPTGLLKPSGIENGMRALWSPVMRPTEGWCMQGCNACSQACPTDAIVFGNINDPKSRVAQIHADARAFRVIEEVNTKPSIAYLTKVRNKEEGANHVGHH